MTNERLVRRSLVIITLLGLVLGGAAYLIGRHEAAHWIWMAATVPVVIALALSIARDLMAGRMGVDAIALLAMSGALALDQSLAAIVVAIMYAGGTVLEDYAVARAERNLKSLIDRAPRLAHRRNGQAVEDVAIKDVKIGDRAPCPRRRDHSRRWARLHHLCGASMNQHSPASRSRSHVSGGERPQWDAQRRRHIRSEGDRHGRREHVRRHCASRHRRPDGQAPFIRLADRYALLLLPVTILVAGFAWFCRATPSGDLPSWSSPLRARSYLRRPSPSSPASPKQLAAA